MEDKFQLVKSKKRKCRPKQIFNLPKSSPSIGDVDSLHKKLFRLAEEFDTSYFCIDFIKKINKSLDAVGRNTINEIISYGLGKFTENTSSLHQLAALIVISNKFYSTVTIFDPLFDSTEILLLEKLGFEVINENEEGKRKISSDKTTLIYLPHCPKQLTNNFLWANWNINLKNCIIISNSFSKIIESHTEKTLQESANYINKIFKFTEEIELENTYEIVNAFNDLSIHYFNNSELNSSFFEGEVEEPKYLKDTEFITKELKNLLI